MTNAQRFLGITAPSPYIQNEGIDGILSNLVKRTGTGRGWFVSIND